MLLTEVIPPETVPGKKEAVWDEERFRMAVTLRESVAEPAVGSRAVIEEERGRWVVYLEVGFWDAAGAEPVKITRRRIKDYPTRRDAEVAASWMERSSDRHVNRSVEGGQ